MVSMKILLLVLAVFIGPTKPVFIGAPHTTASGSTVITSSGGTGEMKAYVGDRLLDQMQQDFETLSELMTSQNFHACPTAHPQEELRKLIDETTALSRSVRTLASTHLPTFARKQWVQYYPSLLESCEKIDAWLRGLPEHPCTDEKVLEKLTVKFSDQKSRAEFAKELLNAIIEILEITTDVRLDLYQKYTREVTALKAEFEKIGNDLTIVCAVSGYGPAPAYSKVLDPLLDFLQKEHPKILELEESTRTNYLSTAHKGTLEPVINSAKTNARTALTLGRELAEKCTNPSFKESKFAELYKLNAKLTVYGKLMSYFHWDYVPIAADFSAHKQLFTLADSVATHWDNTKNEVNRALRHCTLMTTLEEEEEDQCF